MILGKLVFRKGETIKTQIIFVKSNKCLKRAAHTVIKILNEDGFDTKWQFKMCCISSRESCFRPIEDELIINGVDTSYKDETRVSQLRSITRETIET